MMNEEFKLYRTFASSLQTIGIPGLMLAIGSVILVLVMIKADEMKGGPPLAFLLLWIAGIGYAVVKSLRMPTTIELEGSGRIVFRSLLRKTEVDALAVVSIKPGGNQLGILTLKHSGGTIHLVNQFDGFHRFLGRLKELNPAVELRGC